MSTRLDFLHLGELSPDGEAEVFEILNAIKSTNYRCQQFRVGNIFGDIRRQIFILISFHRAAFNIEFWLIHC